MRAFEARCSDPGTLGPKKLGSVLYCLRGGGFDDGQRVHSLRFSLDVDCAFLFINLLVWFFFFGFFLSRCFLFAKSNSMIIAIIGWTISLTVSELQQLYCLFCLVVLCVSFFFQCAVRLVFGFEGVYVLEKPLYGGTLREEDLCAMWRERARERKRGGEQEKCEVKNHVWRVWGA